MMDAVQSTSLEVLAPEGMYWLTCMPHFAHSLANLAHN